MQQRAVYEEWLEEALSAQSTKNTERYPARVWGQLWQISAQYPGSADLLVLRKRQPTFVTTFMKSHLKAICFLSKADAEKYAGTLAVPPRAVIKVKQSPKNKLCVSHPEIIPGAYVVEESDMRNVNVDDIPFLNKDGTVAASKDDSYIKLTPRGIQTYLVHPLAFSLQERFAEAADSALPKIFSEISTEESTEGIKLPKTFDSKYLSLILSYNKVDNQISISTYAAYRGVVTLPPNIDHDSFASEVIDERGSYLYKNADKYTITDHIYDHLYTRIDMKHRIMQYAAPTKKFLNLSFSQKFGEEVSLKEIGDMKEELQIAVENYIEEILSETNCQKIKSEIKEKLHPVVIALDAKLPEFELVDL